MSEKLDKLRMEAKQKRDAELRAMHTSQPGQEIPAEDVRHEDCYLRAKKRGQWTFTLVAQDITSPSVIAEWIKLNIETAPENKLREALNDALIMRKWITRKRAD